jgi:hypothetical protein
MKVKYYNPVDEKGTCVIRSISKALNKDYNLIKKELGMNYNDESVFESYLFKNGFITDNTSKDKLLKDINLKGINIVFAHIDDWYHMMCVIDNVIYDKSDFNDLKDMKVIKIYELKEGY